jgi:AcrR family transcriptional regulator
VADDTRTKLLAAARSCLIEAGHGQLSTRQVADRAGMPLSQIHYHFGGKQGLVLALLERENELLLERQRTMYDAETPIWRRYEQACDFLEEDLASGYVRMLQEMVAAGWADPSVARQVTLLLRGWFDLLEQVVTEAEGELGGLGRLDARMVGTLVGLSFLGGESLLLLDDGWRDDVLSALRSPVALLREGTPVKRA